MGRVWMGGRGLWMLDEHGRVVRYDEGVPFLQDAYVVGLANVGERLAVALGDRGIAIVRP